MLLEMSIASLLTYALVIFIVILALRKRTETAFKYPPSPRSFSLFGHDGFLKGLSQLEFAQWLSKQGPIIRLILNGQNWIGINSFEIANLLFIKNGNNFSSRPFIPLLCDVVFRNAGIAVMPYGDDWRKHRRFVHTLINPSLVNEMEDMLKEEVETMIKRIEESLEKTDVLDIAEHIYDYSLACIMRVLFGRIKSSQNDHEKPFLIFRQLAHDTFIHAAPPRFNIWKLLPFGHKYSKSELQRSIQVQNRLDRFIEFYLDQVRVQIKEGTADDSVARKYLLSCEKGDNHGLEAWEFNSLLINLLLAAVETVGDNLAWAVATLAKYPEHQVIAQNQLDSHKQFPILSNMRPLYYIQNIIKESLRMFPSNVMDLPRENIEHFLYEGHDIPAGTTVVLNIYALNRDPGRYQNPNKFDPSRFGTNLTSTEIDPFTFGVGRRMCPGTHLAKAEMFCALAGLLWNYEFIEDPKHPITLSTAGFSMSNPPLPYKVRVKKRQISKAH